MQPSAAIHHLSATRRSVATPFPPPGPRTGPRAGRATATATATVHSVYRGAVNVVGPGGLLVLAPVSSGGLPNGILVTAVPDFRGLGLVPGDPVVASGDALRLGGGVVVELADAVPWSPRLPATGPGAPAAMALRRWRRRSALAHRIAAALAHPRGLSTTPGAAAALHAAARAIAAADRPAAASAARRLVGLGPGLTPSGDDALAGLEAALHALAHPLAGFLAGALDDLDARTTAVSAAILRHAARGEFAERVHELVAGLLGDDDAAPAGALARASAWGATSGSDGVAGVLAGLDAATGVVARVGAAA